MFALLDDVLKLSDDLAPNLRNSLLCFARRFLLDGVVIGPQLAAHVSNR